MTPTRDVLDATVRAAKGPLNSHDGKGASTCSADAKTTEGGSTCSANVIRTERLLREVKLRPLAMRPEARACTALTAP